MSEFPEDIPAIRRTQHNKQTFYSVVDVCTQLAEGKNPQLFWYTFIKNNPHLEPLLCKLDLESRSLHKQPTPCTNAEGILLIVSHIRGRKANVVKAAMAKALSDKLKQTKGTSLVKFIESIE